MAKTDHTNSLKGLAIIAVITIHVTSAYLFVFDAKNSFAWQYKIIVDQLVRFAVPLFVAASGFALTKRYFKANLNLRDFYIRRVLKLLPWYFVASLILFFAFHWQPKTWKQILFLGQGDYQLYFVPMIFQLYIIFPLLRWLMAKKGLLILILSFIFEVGLYQLIAIKTELIFNNNGLWPDQRQYVFFGTWVFYFVLGMYLATKRISWRWGITFLISGLIWTEVSAFTHLGQGMDLIVATRFTRLPVLIYATGLCLVLFNSTWHNKILESFGKHSWQMYLWHTAILRLVLAPYLPYPVSLALSLSLSYLLARLINYVA